MNRDLYFAPDVCKYPCQLQFGEFSLHFCPNNGNGMGQSKRRKSSLGHYAVNGRQRTERNRLGRRKTFAALQVALGADCSLAKMVLGHKNNLEQLVVKGNTLIPKDY